MIQGRKRPRSVQGSKQAQAENGCTASDLSVKLKREKQRSEQEPLPSRCAMKPQFPSSTGSSASHLWLEDHYPAPARCASSAASRAAFAVNLRTTSLKNNKNGAVTRAAVSRETNCRETNCRETGGRRCEHRHESEGSLAWLIFLRKASDRTRPLG